MGYLTNLISTKWEYRTVCVCIYDNYFGSLKIVDIHGYPKVKHFDGDDNPRDFGVRVHLAIFQNIIF